MTANDQLHSHVTGEGVVDQNVNAPLGAGFHNGVALCNFVSVHDDVSSGGDNTGILLRGTGDQQDVVTAHFTDLVKTSLGTGNGLAHNNGLDVRIGGEADQRGNGGLHLGHEVVGIGGGNDVISAPGGDGLLGGAEFFLTLGDGAGQNSDLPVVIGSGLGNGSGGLSDGGFRCGGGSSRLCGGLTRTAEQAHGQDSCHC